MRFLLAVSISECRPVQAELLEETGYWRTLVEACALRSPGFLGEWMQVFLAGDAQGCRAEDDEQIDLCSSPANCFVRSRLDAFSTAKPSPPLLYDRLRKNVSAPSGPPRVPAAHSRSRCPFTSGTSHFRLDRCRLAGERRREKICLTGRIPWLPRLLFANQTYLLRHKRQAGSITLPNLL
jgi:hypothetical protein